MNLKFATFCSQAHGVRFYKYDFLKNLYGEVNVENEALEYKKVFEAETNIPFEFIGNEKEALDHVYRLMKDICKNLKSEMKVNTLSMTDIVLVEGRYFFVDDYGFKELI